MAMNKKEQQALRDAQQEALQARALRWSGHTPPTPISLPYTGPAWVCRGPNPRDIEEIRVAGDKWSARDSVSGLMYRITHTVLYRSRRDALVTLRLSLEATVAQRMLELDTLIAEQDTIPGT